MSTSQNGWAASTNKSDIGVADFVVHGVSFPGGVKKGDVATVLGFVAEQFSEHVEALHSGWCWGYDYKVIEGSSVTSNHASGTAIDINAPHHPMGESGTFTPSQVNAIRNILSTCHGMVRWGGDYTGRKDEMHFEINANANEIAWLAAHLRGLPTPTPPVVHPPTGGVLSEGSHGAAVSTLQTFFNAVFPAYRNTVAVNRGHLLVADGIFGPATKAWVEEFQRRVSIRIDGVVGTTTVNKLRSFGYPG